jgi:hypothetical protein
MSFARTGLPAPAYLNLPDQIDQSHRCLPQSGAARLLAVTGLAFAIRIYLTATSYCISGDGVAYLTMARGFAEGNWHAFLGAVYSPLYPALISLMHKCVASWELAGDLVSAILGTAAVATTYQMTRQAFESHDVALGAAILLAIHPAAAAYSASVRTEAGYMFFTTAACCCMFKVIDTRRVGWAVCAGLIAGFGYLYRTEGIGFLPLGAALFLGAQWWTKESSLRSALMLASTFAIAFLTIAAPYIAYLRIASGHWTIGREFNAAMMYGMGDVARNGDSWRQLGWNTRVSPFLAIFLHPRLYAEKVARYVVVSAYSFVQAMEPLMVAMCVIGLWARFRMATEKHVVGPNCADPAKTGILTVPDVLDKPLTRSHSSHLPEAFLAAIVLFYFVGFILSYTGTRFMVHLVPFTLGWVVVGIIFVSEKISQLCSALHPRFASALVPALIVMSILPRTLWPLGYDQRGLRYAGTDIAELKKGSTTVAARDGRVAYYAASRLIELPAQPPQDLCAWLQAQRGDFLMIGSGDEKLFNVVRSRRCLNLLKRYPRHGSSYYDLYGVIASNRTQDLPRSDTETTRP